MKSIFTVLFYFVFVAAYTQSLRDYASFLNDTIGIVSGIEGIFEGPGQVSFIAENKFGNQAHYSFVKTLNYNVEEKAHYKTPGSLFHPTSIVKIGQYIYVSTEYGSDAQKNYGLLKISADTGAPVIFKKINANTNINPRIKLAQIPNSQELLLSFHTTGNDSTSQIHFFSLNSNLEATNYKQMISFPTLKNQGYLAMDHTYDFLLDNSDIHYSIVFYDGNESRLEIGTLNMANNAIDASFATLSATAHEKRSKIAQIKNGATFYMADNSMLVRSANDSVFAKYSFNTPFNTDMSTFELKQMPDDTWMVIYQLPFSPADNSHIGVFDTEELLGGIQFYIPTPSCSSIAVNGNNILILGTRNTYSLTLQEFQMSNFERCTPINVSYTINKSQVNIFDSQAAEITTANYTSTNLTLPTEVEAGHGDDILCNPNHLGLPDSEIDPISIYPNPTSGFIHIQMENEPILNISLKTFTGSQVYQSGTKPNTQIVNISTLPAGIYLVEITTEKAVYTKKIIKQ